MKRWAPTSLSLQPPQQMTRVAVRFEGITKRFGSTVANRGVTFDVGRGTVHAILGENGAGKTTLMKALGGILRPDAGRLWVNGSEVQFHSPRQAQVAGVGMVHQEFSLIPALTVAENLLLERSDLGWYAVTNSASRRIRTEARELGFPMDPEKPVWQLSSGERRLLEVFRVLFLGSTVLILDEPTSVLSPLEGDVLLGRVKALAEAGRCVLLITHKLREIFAFADFVTVMRRGAVVGTFPVASTESEELAALMVGSHARETTAVHPLQSARYKSAVDVLQLTDIGLRGPAGKNVLEGITFSLRAGSIVGVAGISGNGQDELAKIVAGLTAPTIGTINRPPSERIRIGYIPADRLGVGAPITLTVAENLVLRDFAYPPIAKRCIVRRSELWRVASQRSAQYDIQYDGLDAQTGHLSGGNVQRVVIARELSQQVDVLVAHNPTAGLDIGAAAFVQGQLRAAADAGVAVLLLSEDLDELLHLADDIMVLFKGRSMGIFPRASAGISRIARLMVGIGEAAT